MSTDMAELARQLGRGDDPRVRMIEQLMSMQKSESDTDPERARARRLRKLERRAFALLHERNREIAAALGACPCFGMVRRCSECGGRGNPGWVAPDEELFLAYVGPVLEALGILVEDERVAEDGA